MAKDKSKSKPSSKSRPNSKLRVALVCDWLTEIGGAEQVLLQLTKLFPDAPIYTSQYRRKSAPWFDHCDVRPSRLLNILPRGLRKFIAPLRALYFNHLTISGYDLVISVCNAECKGVKTPDSTLHIAYLQGPPTQYYWSQYDRYIDNPGFGRWNWLARFGLKLLLKPMRKSDLKASARPDIMVVNSHYVLDEMRKYYNRDGEVILPPVGVEKLREVITSPDDLCSSVLPVNEREKGAPFGGEPYFVIAGRQVNWKRMDLAVAACAKAVENLLVVGDGPEHSKLVELAGDNKNVKFLPKYNGATEIAGYFADAKGFIFPSLEPFGIIPVEALACGCPVLAFSQGGSQDIVEDGENGLFFAEQSVDSLVDGIKEFNKTKFNRTKVAKTTDRFASANFDKHWLELIERNLEVKD
ncbi:MAG: glycosyltransferase [Candidatus Saccharibacteria bacterium]|nr:glycosyltransferase [Candidatus Saccharibacteria bacterium]